MQRKKAVMNWSGGKDAALALHNVLQDGAYEVIALLTTLDQASATSVMHGIPLALLEQQAMSLGIPLYPVFIGNQTDEYEIRMHAVVQHFKKLGADSFIFGDIHLNDIKVYRESKLNPLGVEVVLPLWSKSSNEVIKAFLASGIKSKIIVVQADKLPKSFVGKDIDATTLDAFPDGVDVCGENGEYHTFTYDGPMFARPVSFVISGVNTKQYDISTPNDEHLVLSYYEAALDIS
jgi:uncharacterized protein (TIGR00290 family)